MTTGTITSIKLVEGYGFIDDGTSANCFFHKSALEPSTVPFEKLRPGDHVEFRQIDHARGRRAIQIRVVQRSVSLP